MQDHAMMLTHKARIPCTVLLKKVFVWLDPQMMDRIGSSLTLILLLTSHQLLVAVTVVLAAILPLKQLELEEQTVNLFVE
mmetsp:Transcript_14378/g.45334  ORF Transcript_14378/g.45334 Transcript_14378/m.45334 type:complete len:80 (-) Transcript_14378:240-479(-)